jgi:glycosyltransferase involved in cell wall biosynthesis
MKIALVHDHLAQKGGAENVVKIFHEIFPDAPIFVLVYDKKVNKEFNKADVRTSYIQNFPFGLKQYKYFLPFMPNATESFPLEEFDIILSSCSMFAKGVITNSDTLHFCYCHTPTRFLWTETNEYMNNLKYNKCLKKMALMYLTQLRAWDRLSADRVDKFIANSVEVKKRIAKYYRRNSVVIYPPVEVDKFYISSDIKDYFLAGGRLVSYKRFDLIIKAFNRIGINLKIFGIGPEYKKLRKMAKKNIEFLGSVSEKDRAELFSQSQAFLNPQVEDFGIITVEAMASGRPVIAYNKGGAVETIIPGVTGELFDEQSWEDLADYVVRFDPSKYDPQTIHNHAQQFSVLKFKNKIKDFIFDSYKNWPLCHLK